ncbi:hypothetical protein [Corynebacterium mastitidis]|uniref:Uncharacterized protein n=1 Tax=Corynebacterium mastitidis TaxID=161890 RepID=A0A2N0X9G5_9CORY|nr:hypothetical protein [Corynebacterium mastitidis]PKF69345.1 hypothetical protein CXB45_02390 [Corynebacterium mastitidis]
MAYPAGEVTGSIKHLGATITFHNTAVLAAYLPADLRCQPGFDHLRYTLSESFGKAPQYADPTHLAVWAEGYNAGVDHLAAALGLSDDEVHEALQGYTPTPEPKQAPYLGDDDEDFLNDSTITVSNWKEN